MNRQPVSWAAVDILQDQLLLAIFVSSDERLINRTLKQSTSRLIKIQVKVVLLSTFVRSAAEQSVIQLLK